MSAPDATFKQVSRGRGRGSTNQYVIHSSNALFTDNHCWVSDGFEDHCARLDEIAAEDHSYIVTAAERARRENTWVVLDSSGPIVPMNQKEDYQEVKNICERLFQESDQARHRHSILESKFE